MKHRHMKMLMILSGVACLAGVGWIVFDRFSGTNDSPDLAPLVNVASSRIFSSEKGKHDSQPRSLEELNEALRIAKEEWQYLADTRYFFQDYADEVVSEFSLEEIRLLAFERTCHDFSSVVGFHYAIMRRWGELDCDDASSRFSEILKFYRNAQNKTYYLSLTEEEKKEYRSSGLKEELAQAKPLIFSEKEKAMLRKHREIESYPGSAVDFLHYFHRKFLDEVIIGGVRGDPIKFVSQILEADQEHKEKGTYDSPIHIEDFKTLVEAFKNLAEQDPKEALALIDDKEKLELISPWRHSFTSDKEVGGVNATPMIRGYFLGLPDKSNWLNIYESLDPDFQRASLVPMLARWMDDDVDTALGWIRKQSLPASLFVDEGDPFASPSELKSLKPLLIDQHSLVIGHAGGIWFRRNPEEALDWIGQNIQDLAPEVFEGLLLVVIDSGSPTGFLAILGKIQEVENIQIRGRAILSFQKNMEFFTSMYPYSYEWREERRILEVLKKIELDTNHREDLDKVIKEAERSVEIMSGSKGN